MDANATATMPPTAAAIRDAINESRARVSKIMWTVTGHRPDAHIVDDVLQRACIAAVERADRYDPSLGSLGAWAGGFVERTTNHAIRELLRSRRHVVSLTAANGDVTAPVQGDRRPVAEDPLELLIGKWRAKELVSRVTARVSDLAWQVLLDTSIGDLSTAQSAHTHGISVRRAQELRAGVLDVATTVRAALVMRERGATGTTVEVIACLPAHFERWGQVLVKGSRGETVSREQAADLLGVSPSRAGNEFPVVKRLLTIAEDILREPAE